MDKEGIDNVGGGVGVDEDTGATCLVPEAHLTVDGLASIMCKLYISLINHKSQITKPLSHNCESIRYMNYSLL